LFDWLYHTCPKCRVRARKKILRKVKKSSQKFEGSGHRWTREGVEVEEPYTIYLHDYRVEHACRACGHTWVEHVTERRPW
jgi:hypothetical protein